MEIAEKQDGPRPGIKLLPTNHKVGRSALFRPRHAFKPIQNSASMRSPALNLPCDSGNIVGVLRTIGLAYAGIPKKDLALRLIQNRFNSPQFVEMTRFLSLHDGFAILHPSS